MEIKKILIFGAGRWGEHYYNEIHSHLNIKVCAFIDNNKKGNIDGILINEVSALLTGAIGAYDEIHIASRYFQSMLRQLIGLNVPTQKIIIVFPGDEASETITAPECHIEGKMSDFVASFSNIRLVAIEIFSFCNRTCWFCPNSIFDRHSQNIIMDETLYLNILEQLKNINYDKQIGFCSYNEPLADRIFLMRLKQARAFCPNAELRTNTNGDYVTREYIDELADAGLNVLQIQSYFAENEQYDEEILKSRIQKMADKLGLSYSYDYSDEDIYKVIFNYDKMFLCMYGRDFRKNGNTRGGSLGTIPPVKRLEPCTRMWTDIYIDFNGSVMPCCNLRSDNPSHEKFRLYSQSR